ncbi:glycosyltransferase family 2 protein [Hufsiella ginkgonis]|uniref:Glycosyltransferase n=1 Tax=Hufsiella ginkgonis TaxID=2695274 RepID=A0A7K1Y2B6_9SPHI|nr:glycosyltransferase family 2 protein [Hufsiella ginkgonis]MXV17423.1 glycosyltransferase [Hufsiella ginkgonis]
MNIIAVIIPIYNRIEITKKGLAAIYQAVTRVNGRGIAEFELVVVDDASTDGSSEWINSNYPKVHVVRTEGNQWWTGSVNAGIRFAMEHFKDRLHGLILQNDDVLVDEDWLENFYDVIRDNPGALIGCAAADVNARDIILYGGKFMHPWSAKTTMYNASKKLSDVDINTLTSSSDLIGRGVFLPVEVIRKVGLYDFKHFKHRGDTELPVRARRAGFPLLVTYKALVYINPETTSGIDIKKNYTLKDFKARFFDFRSSSYWKYRYYYARSHSENLVQRFVFFACDMARHLNYYLSKMK